MQRADLCVGCGKEVVRWVRSDKRHCGGVCRMLAHRRRNGGRRAKSARQRGASQSTPAQDQSPNVAADTEAAQTRAEESERVCADLQRRHDEQTVELDRVRKELSALQCSFSGTTTKATPAPDLSTPDVPNLTAKLREYFQQAIAAQTPSRAPSLAVRRAEEPAPAAPDGGSVELRTRLHDCRIAYQRAVAVADQRGRSLKAAQLLTAELTQRAERAEKTVAERSRQIEGMQTLLDHHQRARADLSAVATELQSRLDAERLHSQEQRSSAEQILNEKNIQVSDLSDRLEQCQSAHAEIAAVATQLQGSLQSEQTWREQAEQRLAYALDEAARRAQTSDFAGWDAESVWQTYDRAELLQAEVDELRRQRDETLAEREQLSARILHLMMPGEYRPQLALGYDPAVDPLVRQKRVELTVLAQYWEWQDAHAKRRTGRPMNQTKTMDEQALEAAQCARWMLINDPPQRLRSEPCWVEFPWKLDEASETLAIQMSEEKILDRRTKMSEPAD